MEHDTAGDPMTGLKWTRRTTRKIAEELENLGIIVSPSTVARLLKEMGYSLRVNHKKVSSGSGPDRNEQFVYIGEQRHQFTAKGLPILSVDAKKRELVGNFKNAGQAWSETPLHVKDHDFRSEAEGIAIPYGVYDLQANLASVFVGTSCETPEFAAASIAKWWRFDGRSRYPGATEMLILADSGGGNGVQPRAWKSGVQERLCDKYGLAVTLCHYPAGASKWNPIEHHVFSEISKNWQGRPLESYETVLNYLRTMATRTGLKVKAYLDPRSYEKGIKVSDGAMADLSVHRHEVQPRRNYTIKPR